MSNFVLQIYENETPLRLSEIGILLLRIKDEFINDAAQESLHSNKVPKSCDNPDHLSYKKYVGGGICLAKKYKRLGMATDQICQACQSKNIVETLNFIFEKFYAGMYSACWRVSRKSSVAEVRTVKKRRGRGPQEIKEEIIPTAKEKSRELLSKINKEDPKIRKKKKTILLKENVSPIGEKKKNKQRIVSDSLTTK